MNALADILGPRGKADAHAVVEDEAFAFPMAGVAIFFAVFDDAAFQLVDTLEAFTN